MNNIKLKPIAIRRFIAYFIDSMIIGVLFQGVLLFNILPTNDSKTGFSILYFISILISFGYYILFWTNTAKNTAGQFLCRLQIKHRVTAKACIKRLIYLHLGPLFYWGALSYMNIRGLAEEVANSYLVLTAIIVITLHLIYGFNVDRIDKVSGIEVVEK
jgi:hypothetical protein